MASVQIPLPKFIPNVAINDLDYQSGFDESLCISGPLTNAFLCSLCKGIPRHPVNLENCGHLFCESCIQKHFQITARHGNLELNFGRSAPCANCREPYKLHSLILFNKFSPWAKQVYQSLSLKCPLTCPFIGNPLEMDEHQSFTCPLRNIKCPNINCSEIMTAELLEKEHLRECTHLRIYCYGCKLPVLKSELYTHDCFATLRQALESMYTLNSLKKIILNIYS